MDEDDDIMSINQGRRSCRKTGMITEGRSKQFFRTREKEVVPAGAKNNGKRGETRSIKWG